MESQIFSNKDSFVMMQKDLKQDMNEKKTHSTCMKNQLLAGNLNAKVAQFLKKISVDRMHMT